jgi:FkbM family methyltransferase
VNSQISFPLNYEVFDEIIEEIQQFGGYDRYVLSSLANPKCAGFVRPGSVCLDVGANIGVYTIFLALMAGSTGHVTAFEGGRRTSEVLQGNVVLNNLSNAKIVQRPVSRQKKYYDEINAIGKSQSDFIFYEEKQSEGQLISLSIDEYCEAYEKLDFIKVDVNGLDFDILSGAKDSIKNHRPTILVEFVPAEISNEVFQEVAQMLVGLNYFPWFFRGHSSGVLEICTYRMLVELYNVWRAYSPKSWMNVVFAPR